MLFQKCQECNALLPDTVQLETIGVENFGIYEERKVCQVCYNKLMNEDVNLLLEKQ
jgi:hypothetical protein